MIKKVALIALLVVATTAGAQASTLLIAHDTALPIQEYTTGGTYIQSWGTVTNNATGPASDEFGNVYTTNPAFGNNLIEKSNSSNVSQGTCTATIDGQWVEDAGYLGGGILLLGTYEGSVYSLDQSCNHTFMFATGHSFVGVTYDGTDIWTTGGLTTNAVYRRDLAGNVLSSFATPGAVGGIGYDPVDGTLYLGGMGDGTIYHYSTGGSDLGGSFSTGLGNGYYDGLEVMVPEPATAALLGLGLLMAARRRRN